MSEIRITKESSKVSKLSKTKLNMTPEYEIVLSLNDLVRVSLKSEVNDVLKFIQESKNLCNIINKVYNVDCFVEMNDPTLFNANSSILPPQTNFSISQFYSLNDNLFDMDSQK